MKQIDMQVSPEDGKEVTAIPRSMKRHLADETRDWKCHSRHDGGKRIEAKEGKRGEGTYWTVGVMNNATVRVGRNRVLEGSW